MVAISLVLFDLNDVLFRYDKAARIAALAQFAGRDGAAVEAAIWGSGFEDRADSGAMNAAAYLAEFGQRLGHALSLQEWAVALKASLAPMPQALELASMVRERARIAVLTNNNFLVAREIGALLPELGALFGESIHVSAEFHARKPEPEVYRRCVRRLATAPSSTLFVDDSPANVKGAEEAGLLAHRHTTPAALAKALAGFGLLPGAPA
jgi:putative hydrolase of the HAD superfamily